MVYRFSYYLMAYENYINIFSTKRRYLLQIKETIVHSETCLVIVNEGKLFKCFFIIYILDMYI